MRKTLSVALIALIIFSAFPLIVTNAKAETSDGAFLYAGGSDPGVVYKYTGTDWEVMSDELGYAVLCLVEYDGHLYAGTTSAFGSGGIGRVYRYDGGTTWTLVGDNMDNEACSLAVYEGNLYAGTAWNGMKLYRYDGGTTWTQVIGSIPWSGTRSLYVSHGYLLLGDVLYDRFGRWDGSNFYADQSGGGSCIYDYQDFGDYVYAAAYQGRLWRSTDAIHWSTVLGYYDGNMWELEQFQNKLYMSYNNGELRAYDGTGDLRGTLVYTAPDGIISMTTDGSYLYFGTGGDAVGHGPESSGIASVYRYDGTSIVRISDEDEMQTGVQVLYVSSLGPRRFNPKIDGFGFENYGPEEGCIAYTFREVYDRLKNEPDLPLEIPLEILAWIVYQMLTDAHQGHCGGMCRAALHYYDNPEMIPSGFEKVYDIKEEDKDVVFSLIDFYQTEQFFHLDRDLKHILAYLGDDPTGLLSTADEIDWFKSQWEEGRPAYLTVLDPDRGLLWGHAVVAYDYEEDDDYLWIDFYNPNDPGNENAYLTLEKEDGELTVIHDGTGFGCPRFYFDDAPTSLDWSAVLEYLFGLIVPEVEDLMKSMFTRLLSIDLFSCAELHLYDPNGNHIGRLDSSDIDLEFDALFYVDNVGSEHCIIPNPEVGGYLMELVGVSEGSYSLDIASVVEGSTASEQTISREIAQGEIHQYPIGVSETGEMSVYSVEKVFKPSEIMSKCRGAVMPRTNITYTGDLSCAELTFEDTILDDWIIKDFKHPISVTLFIDGEKYEIPYDELDDVSIEEGKYNVYIDFTAGVDLYQSDASSGMKEYRMTIYAFEPGWVLEIKYPMIPPKNLLAGDYDAAVEVTFVSPEGITVTVDDTATLQVN